jgi:hypothetical protein
LDLFINPNRVDNLEAQEKAMKNLITGYLNNLADATSQKVRKRLVKIKFHHQTRMYNNFNNVQ